METGLRITQLSLLIIYGLYGIYKSFFTARVRKSMRWAETRSDALIRFIGVMELLGGLGVVLPMATGILPGLTPLAALGLTLIQIFAIFTAHLPLKEYRIIPLNLYFMAMSLFVLVGRWQVLSQ